MACDQGLEPHEAADLVGEGREHIVVYPELDEAAHVHDARRKAGELVVRGAEDLEVDEVSDRRGQGHQRVVVEHERVQVYKVADLRRDRCELVIRQQKLLQVHQGADLWPEGLRGGI